MPKSAEDIMVLGRLVHFLWTFAFFKPKKSITPDPQPIQAVIGEERLRELINFALRYMSEIVLPVKRGNFVEFRNGMINLSPIGQSCTKEERNGFIAFDAEHKIRKKFVEQLKSKFGSYGLEFAIEDQISIKVSARINIDKKVPVLTENQDSTNVKPDEVDQSLSKSDLSNDVSDLSRSSSYSSLKDSTSSEVEDDSLKPQYHDFSTKDEYNDTQLIVNRDGGSDWIYYVNRKKLATHSPIFLVLFLNKPNLNSAFFGDSNEIDEDTFRVEYNKPYYFKLFLQILYEIDVIRDMNLKDTFHVLRIANSFECKVVKNRVVSYLMKFTKDGLFDYLDALFIAYMFSLTKYRNECIKRMTIPQLEEIIKEDDDDLFEEIRRKARKELAKRACELANKD